MNVYFKKHTAFFPRLLFNSKYNIITAPKIAFYSGKSEEKITNS